MPTRFVEVADIASAARNTDALSYLHSCLPSQLPDLPDLTDLSITLPTLFVNWTNTKSSTLANVRAPTGPPQYLMLFACFILCVRWLGVRVSARRALARYGHADY